MRSLVVLFAAVPALAADYGSPIPPGPPLVAPKLGVPVLIYSGPIRHETQPARAVLSSPSQAPPGYYRPMPARSVPRLQPFRGGVECEYDPDHVCNRCGATQLVIKKWNADGTHSHQCPRCGHSWRH